MNKLLTTLVVALLAVGCSSSDNDPVVQDPTAADVVAVGTITGFGSVIANGIRFDTDSATVTMNGQPGNLSDLRVGMVVTIRATVQERTGAAVASQIMFTDDAQGPISNMNAVTNSFVVLGRKVMFDEMTVFDGAPMEALADGNMVQVSGQWRSQERIQATHIHRIANAYAPGMTMEVKGQVRELNAATLRFKIGSQICDYSAAALELGSATLEDGLYVEVSSSSPLTNGDMLLDRIRAKDRDRDRDQLCDSDCDFEIEGYVSSFTSATEFEVDGQPVTTTDATTYINGTVDSLALDKKLAIDGTIDSAGVLVAERIVFRLPSVVEIEANIEAVDTQMTAVTLLGIYVATDEFTMFRDHSSIGLTDFGFDDLAIGDRTEVRAYIDAADVVASRLERDDADDSVTLKAPAEIIARPDLTLLGMLVTTDQNTVFQNQAMEVIDADTFFSLLVEGSLVKAEGTYDGSSILASKLFLRDCEYGCM
ncbi:MAG: DUF5666 domain-containing protein [Woeseiaceae bacterium]